MSWLDLGPELRFLDTLWLQLSAVLNWFDTSSDTVTDKSFTGLPVWILWTNVHLQQDPLGEGFKALATLPKVPVTEITAQLAGGGWAGQDPLVLWPQLAETGVWLKATPNLVHQGEILGAGWVLEDHGAHQDRGRGWRGWRWGAFSILAEGLERLLPCHSFHHWGWDVYWEQTEMRVKRTPRSRHMVRNLTCDHGPVKIDCIDVLHSEGRL